MAFSGTYIPIGSKFKCIKTADLGRQDVVWKEGEIYSLVDLKLYRFEENLLQVYVFLTSESGKNSEGKESSRASVRISSLSQYFVPYESSLTDDQKLNVALEIADALGIEL